MLSQKPKKTDEEKRNLLIEVFGCHLISTNILSFLSLTINFIDINNIRKVSRIFSSYFVLYKEYLSKVDARIQGLNEERAAIVKTHILQINHINSQKLEKLAELKKEYEDKMELEEKKYTHIVEAKKSDQVRELKEKNKLKDKNILDTLVVLEKNIELLEKFNILLDDEYKKISWWTLRIEYVGGGRGQGSCELFLEYFAGSILIIFSTIFIELLLLTGFLVLGIMLFPALVVAILPLIPTSTTALLFSMSIPGAIAACISFATSEMKFDFRSKLEDLFDNRILSKGSNTLSDKFDEIKAENDPDKFPHAIQELANNPFSGLDNNSQIGTIRNAIRDRLTLFAAKKAALSTNEVKNAPSKTALSITPSNLSLD